MGKKELLAKERELESEIKEMQQLEYGLKELIQGFVIGLVTGFTLAYFLLR